MGILSYLRRTGLVEDEKVAMMEDAHSEVLLPQEQTPTIDRRGTVSRIRSKLLFIFMLGFYIGFGLLLRDFFQTNEWEDDEPTSALFGLVKNAVPSPSPSPSPTPTPKPIASTVLEVFQVYQPVLTPSGAIDETLANGVEATTTIGEVPDASSCELLLMSYSFGYSYGIPFVGKYIPPKCKFNRVTMNFTVTSKGRQFDRLAVMYFNDTEVWRTSTAEPTAKGIRWEYIKDMSEYMYFWDSAQTLIFDLGNLIDSTYTGYFNTTLTATFFTSEDTVVPADLIIPITARRGAASSSSMFTLPSDNATNTIGFPRNVNRAVFSVSACGQATEEFWWGNVLQSDINTFLPYDGTLYGYSPFREVQVLIDGQLAGVHWPFPIIFTGGVVPGLWRPIVGIDAFDLREYEIDITPWLPVLCNGASHTFEIRVAGILDNGKGGGTMTETVGSSWYVTGKIFVWLDSNSKSVTKGSSPILYLPPPKISLSQTLTQDSSGANKTLEYTTNVQRALSISSKITTQSGSKTVSWSQNLGTTNYGLYTAYGAIQQNNQSTVGTDTSTGGTYYKSSYSYPLYAYTSYIVDPASGNYTIGAQLIRGLSIATLGTPVFPAGLQPFSKLPQSAFLTPNFQGASLDTTQNCSAYYFASPSAGTSSSFGSTSQEFKFAGVGVGDSGTETELYYRNVEAVNATVVKDIESLVGTEVGRYTFPVQAVGPSPKTVGMVVSPKVALGRGPGEMKNVLVQGG